MIKRLIDFIKANQALLRFWRKKKREFNYFKTLIRTTEEQNLLNKTIVIDAIRSHINTFDSEIYYGIVLALNGAKVKVLIDDGIMMHTEDYLVDNLPTYKRKIDEYSLNPYYHYFFNYKSVVNKIIQENLSKKAFKTYQHKNLEYINYSDIINVNNLKYDNLNELKQYAESSTIRFFKTTQLDYNNKYVRYYYLLSLKNALIGRTVGEYIQNEINPDYYVVSHAIYSTFAPTYEFLRNNGIKCRVYGGAKLYATDFRDIYFTDTKVQTLSQSIFWKKFKDAPVTQEMINKTEEFLNLRMNNATADMKYFNYMKKENLFKIDKNDGYKYHIGLFPNIIWDGNINERHITFDSYLDWIISTIKHLKNNKDIRVYLKSHPGELKWCKNSDKILDLVNKSIDVKEFKNLVIIPPELQINTYEFIKSGIDLCITYDGILALEMPILKIPSIMCVKNGRTSVEGGNFIASTRQEYFNYLDNIDKLLEEFYNNYEKYYSNIIRYAYWYIFGNNVRLPTLRFDYHQLSFDVSQLTKKDLKLDNKLLEIFN